MQLVKVGFLSFAMAMSIQPRTQGAVATAALVFGAKKAAKNIAIAGLSSPLVGAAIGYIGGKGDAMAVYILLYTGSIFGAILLDAESDNFHFAPLDEAYAAELAISPKQLASYNSELEEINLVLAEVTGQLVAKTDGPATVEQSRQLWNEYRHLLAPETFEVLEKLTTKYE